MKEVEHRNDCEWFLPKRHEFDTGDCQTDGHYLCAGCRCIAPPERLEEGDNIMRYYPDYWKEIKSEEE